MFEIKSSSSSSRSSSPSPSHVLLGNDRQATLEEDTSPSRSYSPSLFSSHTLTAELDSMGCLLQNRDAEIARQNSEITALYSRLAQYESARALLADLSSIDISPNIGGAARHINAENEDFRQKGKATSQGDIQESGFGHVGESSKSKPTFSATTNLIDEARWQANYQATSSKSNNAENNNALSVEIPQCPSITIDPEDVELLQQALRMQRTYAECESILENRPDIHSFVSNLREIKSQRDAFLIIAGTLGLLGFGTGIFLAESGIMPSDEGATQIVLSIVFLFFGAWGFIFAGKYKSDQGDKIIERLNYSASFIRVA